MPEPTRKLAAIVFTDIVGFTKLSAGNEPAALSLLEKQRELLKPIVEKHGGSWLKEIGDGLLLSFETTKDAVDCAIEIQKIVKEVENLNLRIGIHQGEVVFQGNDVIGDDVNIAARIEPFAAPGGIAISGRVNASLERDPDFQTHYLGQPQLKGVSQTVKAYCITSHGLPKTDMSKVNAKLEPEGFQWNVKNTIGIAASMIGLFMLINFMFLRIGYADKDETPSIAILPFENKGAEADDFYAYGISSDLITDVTGAGLIRVASMGDIEKLDYKNLENNELAKKLFVRYVAKGTLWKMDSIFQLSMEIFDTKLSKVVYNKRWQTAWIDLAVIKDDLSDNILETLEIEVLQDSEFAKKINPDAYELYLKAKHKHKKRQSADDTEIAQDLLMKALELDENLVDAKLLLGSTYRDLSEYDKALDIYKQALSLAGKLNDEDKKASSYDKIVSIFWYKGELDSILFYQKKKYEIGVALENKQYISQSLSGIGEAYQRKSDYDNAIKNFEKAMVVYEELDDKSGIGSALQDLGGVYTYKRDNEKALEYQKRAVAIFEELEDKNSLRWGLTVLGWTYNAQRDHENAIVSFERALPLAEELGNKRAVGDLQKNLGVAYGIKGDNVKALEYYEGAISIYDELGDKNRVAYGLKDIGWFHLGNENVDKSIEYLKRALLILIDVGNNHGIETTLMGIGEAFFTLGDYDKAIDHYDKAKISSEERGNKSFVMWSMGRIGQVYYTMGDNEKALELFENYFSIQKEIGETEPSLSHMTYLYLTYKNLEKDFDVSEIQKLINEDDEIGYGAHFRLYELLGDSVHLKKAYDKVQEKADDMEDQLKENFLSYPIPKQIIDKYNKVLS